MKTIMKKLERFCSKVKSAAEDALREFQRMAVMSVLILTFKGALIVSFVAYSIRAIKNAVVS
jgi:hypothetical protein